MLCEGCYRLSIVQRFCMDGRKRFEYSTCGRVFALKTEGNLRFKKISGYVWTAPHMGDSDSFKAKK